MPTWLAPSEKIRMFFGVMACLRQQSLAQRLKQGFRLIDSFQNFDITLHLGERCPRNALHRLNRRGQLSRKAAFFFLARPKSQGGRLKITLVSKKMLASHWVGQDNAQLTQVFGIGDSLLANFLDHSVDDTRRYKFLADPGSRP
jgi:hypothetical protein